MRGERENLIRLKAAHAGVNAKAWDTAHTELDRELEKFQKFLKSKARRSAEEEVQQVLSFQSDSCRCSIHVCARIKNVPEVAEREIERESGEGLM